MTNEEKSILLKDLCSRVSNGGYVKVSVESTVGFGKDCVVVDIHNLSNFVETTDFNLENVKVYLRPMFSITEEECDEIKYRWIYTDKCWDANHIADIINRGRVEVCDISSFIDWLNKKMFDYRGLIHMGLALPAEEGIYEIK